MPLGITTVVGHGPIPFGGLGSYAGRPHRSRGSSRSPGRPASFASVRQLGDAGQVDSTQAGSDPGAYTTGVQPSGGIIEQAYISWLRATGQTKAANDLEFPGPQVGPDVLAKAEGDTAGATGSNTPGATLPGIFDLIPWWVWAGGAALLAVQLGWKPLGKR